MRQVKTILTAGCLMMTCFIYSNSYAQLNGWEQINPFPTVYGLYSIEAVNNNLFVAGDCGTILKSSNNGNNWEKINISTSENFKGIKFFNKDTGIVYTSDKYFYTKDGAVSWSSGSLFQFVTIDKINSKTGFAISTNGGLYSTSNAGINWLYISFSVGLGSYTLTGIKFINATTGYLGTSNYKVLKTTNGGQNWNVMFTHQNTHGYINNFVFTGNDTIVGFSTSWRVASTNGGNNWTESFTSGAWAETCLWFNNGIIYKSDGGNINKSINLGLSWDFHLFESVLSITDNNGILFSCSQYSYLNKSANGGVNWININGGIIGEAFNRIYINPDDPQNILFGDWSTFYKYEPANNSLTLVNYNLPSSLNYKFSNNRWWCADGFSLELSTNNGISWSNRYFFQPGQNPVGLRFNSPTNGFMVLGALGHVMKTENAGYNWTYTHNFATQVHTSFNNIIHDRILVFSAVGDKIFYLDTLGNFVGEMSIPINSNIRTINIKDSIIVLADYTGKIHVSHNLGNTWQTVYNSNLSFVNCSIKDRNKYTLITDQDKIVSTTNNGATWYESFLPRKSWIPYYHTDGYLYLSGNNGALMRSQDHITFLQTIPQFSSTINNLPIKYTINIAPYDSTTLDNYKLQISSDSIFNNIVIDTVFENRNMEIVNSPALIYNNNHYSRVKILRKGLESDWSFPYKFIPTMSYFPNWAIVKNDSLSKQKNNKIEFINNTTGFVISDSGRIYKTNNLGIGWKKYQFAFTKNLNDFLNFNNETLFICGDSGIVLMSPDAGNNWTSISTGTMSDFTSINKDSLLNLYLTTKSGQILKSSNSGSSWLQSYSDSTKNLSDIIFTNGIGICVGKNSAVLRTTNFGESWIGIALNKTFNINAILYKDSKFFIAGDSGNIQVSNDLGLTFQSQTSHIRTKLNSLTSSGNYIYAVGDSAIVLRSANLGINWGITRRVIYNDYSSLFINPNAVWAIGDKNTFSFISDLSSLTEIGSEDNLIISSFSLHQNYPNPFNPVTKIKFDVPNTVNVSLKIYDILGKEIAYLVKNELLHMGRYEVTFDASKLSSGIYFYKLHAGDFMETKRMVLVK